MEGPLDFSLVGILSKLASTLADVNVSIFVISTYDTDYILEQSIIAENKIKQFIDEIKQQFNLTNNQICLSGFSQGCMMSLNVGLTTEENFLCIVGF